jgi:hypothetical protein
MRLTAFLAVQRDIVIRRTSCNVQVDEDTRVIGIDGLRVVDSSIMPSITTGNLKRADDHDRREGIGSHP